jgi:hypothetical protein
VPIKITKFQETPAIQYDHLHMTECSIRRATTQDARTEIKAVFVPYGYDGNGQKVFSKTGEITFVEKDFLTLAEYEGSQGDITYLQAMGTMELAIAKILRDQRPELVGDASFEG